MEEVVVVQLYTLCPIEPAVLRSHQRTLAVIM